MQSESRNPEARNLRARALALALALSASLAHAQQNLGPVPYPPENPPDPNRQLLGMALFWDEQLSSNRTVACGTCHVFAAGGSDPRSLYPTGGSKQSLHPGPDLAFFTADDSVGSMGVSGLTASGAYRVTTFGIERQVTRRKSPSVINAAYRDRLFWDGRAGPVFLDPVDGVTVVGSANAALESQAAAPPVNDVEMGHFGITWLDLVVKLQSLRPLALASNVPPRLATFVAGKTYRTLFTAAFGASGIHPRNVAMALAAYERTLVADQTPYDLFRTGQGSHHLTTEQQAGLALFAGKARCTECHRQPFLFDTILRNTGVRPWQEDPGAGAGRFKIPDLRNVALRAPYFHNGRGTTLQEVIDFYDAGGTFAENRDPLVLPLGLSSQEKAQLLAFLQALTDPRVAAESFPFDRPRLWSEGAQRSYGIGLGSPGAGGAVPRALYHEPAFVDGIPTRMTYGLTETSGGIPAFLALDVARAPGAGIPFGNATIQLALTPQCIVLQAGTTTGSGPGGGSAALVVPIPATQALKGATTYGQWLVLDPGAVYGFATSQGFGTPFF